MSPSTSEYSRHSLLLQRHVFAPPNDLPLCCPHRYLLGLAAQPTNIEQDHLFGLLASGLLAGATSAWALKGAADRNELDTPTHERLQVSLALLELQLLGSMAQGSCLSLYKIIPWGLQCPLSSPLYGVSWV